MLNTGGAVKVLGWSYWPRSAMKLYEHLETTTDEELIVLMTKIGGAAGRIAWAEWGKRKFGVAYGIMDGCSEPLTRLPCTDILWS